MIVRLSLRGATLEHAYDFQRFEIVESLSDAELERFSISLHRSRRAAK